MEEIIIERTDQDTIITIVTNTYEGKIVIDKVPCVIECLE
jgi:hypothetical protein